MSFRFTSIACCVAITMLTLSGCRDSPGRDYSQLPVVSRPQSAKEVEWFWDEDRKYGLRDAQGKLLVPPTYDDVSSFSEGLAAVNIGAEWIFPGIPDGGKWGFANQAGKLVIPLQYDYADDFSDGLAQVGNYGAGGETLFINADNEVILRIPDGTAGSFSNGLAPVYVDRSLQGKSWLTRYTNKQGEVEFEVDGYGREFHEGLAAVSIRHPTSDDLSQSHFINLEGERAIQQGFADVQRFSEGLAAAQPKAVDNGVTPEWGYINKSGDWVIEPEFNEVHPFQDGKAVVHYGGTLQLWEDAPAEWEGGVWLVIDSSGTALGRLPD